MQFLFFAAAVDVGNVGTDSGGIFIMLFTVMSLRVVDDFGNNADKK